MSDTALEDPAEPERRSFLSRLSGLTMAGGLVAGYGMFVHVAGRFLYPARSPKTAWFFVAPVDRFARGASMLYRTPSGAKITIARQSSDGEFLALSSICPHLGCQVRWEPHNTRFFCPCHNGVFDAGGRAVSGPPADADQSLSRYPLKIEKGLLYIGLQETVADAGQGRLEEPCPARGPGHDPVLSARRGDHAERA